ncbi:hypothetical protein [Pedobacter antarcticus]|uniref:hypothetical protein n=1 Tax=Pedobacter antarcticus TaxID=34086 RepID=UPI0008819D79|nr:hypothetical protein [Pedobacter antarcticus]SDM40849.1 hypothetical protein SAMN04488084_106179 [Pedobacter antarcticus]
MEIDEIVNRFEFYAQHHVDIAHIPGDVKKRAFLHIDQEELQTAVKQNLTFPALLLQTPTAEKAGVYDNMTEDWSFTFVIIQPLTASLTKTKIISQCKKLTDEILKMLMLDVQLEIVPSVVQGTSEGIVGPLTDKIYGWGVSISLGDAFDAAIDPAKWSYKPGM